jgi:crotonobetainyl-CoA:carnitine CoA-transferase CaiB-like acyl-CoA transferase
LAEIDWSALEALLESARIPASLPGDLVAAVTKACEGRTKAELIAVAHARGFMAAPVSTMEDIHKFEQFLERGLFALGTVQGDGREILVPLRFAQFSDYSMELRRPAPLLSQHTSEVLSDWIGLSPSEVQALFVHGVI